MPPELDRSAAEEKDPAESLTRGFLFSDLRAYTEYMERHGGESAAQLLARYRDLVRIQVARFRGAEIKTEGDSFYIVFPSVSAAVRAALAIVGMAAEESAADPEHAIRVGIGVHAGETVETGEGYVGTPVNIAARLCSLAGAGDVLVSDTVRALTSTVVRADFIPAGRRQLKGIREPIQVFIVRPADAARPASLAPRSRLRRPALMAAAAIVVALALISAVGLSGLLTRPGGPSAPPASGPTPSATRPEPSASSGLTSGERQLLALVPAEVAPRCAPGPGEGVPRSASTLRCDLPLGSGADTVWWDAYLTKADMTLTLEGIARERGVPAAECGPTASEGDATWQLGTTFSGRLVCYAEGSRTWVVWTYVDERILARAVRGDGDWPALYGWWRDISGLVRGR
jgi:class 3 adenylate cyclase